MKLLDRYLISQFLSTFILVLLGLPFLFVITDLTEQFDTYLGRGLDVGTLAESYLYYLPQLFYWGFPIAALIATVFTIGNMTRHQEIAAAKAGGVSFYRLSAPLILVAALLSLVAVGIGEIVPVANETRAILLQEANPLSGSFRMNFVFRTGDGRTLSASRYNGASRAMDNVVLEGRNEEAGITYHQAASVATFDEQEGWTFHDGYLRWMTDSGEEATFQFVTLEVADLAEGPEELMSTASKEAEEMRYGELERYIRMVERSGGNPNEYRVNLAQRFALPLALFVIVLFGAPLATTNRRAGPAFGIAASLIVTMAYLALFRVGESMGTSGSIHPLVAAWTPNGLFLAGALILLWRVRT